MRAAKRNRGNWRRSRKTIRRDLTVTVGVPLYYGVVEQVLESIQNDTLHVFHPDDERALTTFRDRSGAIVVNKRATLPISIRQWLCVGCQLIEMESNEDPDCLGAYHHNAFETIFPVKFERPAGPAAFLARITLTETWMHWPHPFVVAHELVHTFDMMRFVVPAFLDWEEFWKKVLQNGTSSDLAHTAFHDKACFLDNYGSEHERDMVAEFWGAQGEAWFHEFRKRAKHERKGTQSN